MAMGQEQQRRLHPFFTKDWNESVNSMPETRLSGRIAQNKTQLAITDNPLPHDSQHLEFHPSPWTGHDTVQYKDASNGQYAGEDGVLSGYRIRTSPAVATLVDDPNSDRRKRRRTGDIDDSTSEKGIGTARDHLLESSACGGLEQASHNDASCTITTPGDCQSSTTGNVYNLGCEHSSDIPPTTVQEYDYLNGSGGIETSDNVAKQSPKRKTMKLSSNGKLLSSPVFNEGETKSQKKPGGRRGRPRKSRHEEKKLVILRYACEWETKDRVGRLIDDIVNGRRKHTVQEHPAISAGLENQPPKPTHPFFLKKSSQKTETSSPSQTLGLELEADGKEQQSEKVSEKPKSSSSDGSNKLFLPPKQRVPKFPEPVDPLWPPRDLVHIRAAESDSRQHLHDPPSILERDQKKSKAATVRINDKEDVLLLCLRRALFAADGRQLSRTGTAPDALRVPGKHITSPRVLREAMIYELLGPASRTSADTGVPKKLFHPALTKLTSSMANSMTAFDRGEFEMHLWSQKYSPNSADEVLQVGREAVVLRDWLRYLMVSAVETGKSCKDGERAKQKQDREKRKKRRRKVDGLDGFVVSSESEEFEMDKATESEDELAGGVTSLSKKTIVQPGDLTSGAKAGTDKCRTSNAILLSGPSGCGKTASVYAVARELGFEVFEINPGNRRSAKDILERVGDMTQNHLVRTSSRDDTASRSQSPDSNMHSTLPEEGRQNKMMSFFRPLSTRGAKQDLSQTGQGDPAAQKEDLKRPRSQKQSLILLEEADILFEDDKQFWSGVMNLIDQSKRPIVITCNDESLVPLEDISFYAILRYRSPPVDLVVDYLLLIAASEGHMLKREAVADLYTVTGRDLRRSIMDLNFWCQMGVGSKKSGLDWIIDRWPPGSNVDEHGEALRVISLNTYERFMGWFSRDMILSSNDLNREVELGLESLDWWQVDVQGSEALTGHEYCRPPRSESLAGRLDQLRDESDHADMRSDLDILCLDCSLGLKDDAVDISVPSISEKQRASYIEGYPLLHADLKPGQSSLSAVLCTTFDTLSRDVFGSAHRMDDEPMQAVRVLARTSQPKDSGPSKKQFLNAFEPIMRANYVFPLPTGRLSPSFENGMAPISEDLAPYIRTIVAFDLRLEQHRFKLNGVLSQGAEDTRRMRKTRASRAALEGGDKASTRKERWFIADANPSRILATGNKEWQDILAQQGYLNVGSLEEQSRDSCGNASESSGEGGF